MRISTNDFNVLRELGKEYMEAATLPVQKQKIELWKALNRGKMERPMVAIDQLPINELNVNGELNCLVQDPFWKNIEFELRFALYRWRHFPVDMVLDPYITIPKAISNSGFGIVQEVDKIKSDPNGDVYAQHFSRMINNMEDVEKIKDMVITHEPEMSKMWLEEASEVFHGVAPVKSSGGLQFHLGLWDYLTMFMGGVENVYYDLVDQPELLHASMDRMTNSVLAGIKQVNDLQISDDTINTCHCSYIYTDELLPSSGEGKGPLTKNSWAFGLAQLFSSVSPGVTEEFEIPYITKMAQHFGMIYYGCCDRLDDRLEMVKRIPNVKKVSCSPWSNRHAFAEKIGPDLVMSSKPNPAFLAAKSVDFELIRKDLRETVKAAKDNNVNLEFILKDISTVQYQPERLEQWAQIAMEVANE